MKYLKSILEMFDDFNVSLPKDEIKRIANINYGNKGKAYIDSGLKVKNYDIDDMKEKSSKLYEFEYKLKKHIPYLRYFTKTEQNEKSNYISLHYNYNKTVEDLAIFNLKFEISGTVDGGMYIQFFVNITRIDKIKLNDLSYRVSNQELVDTLDVYIEFVKNKFGINDTNDILHKMEDYFSDLKNGNIEHFEDDEFLNGLDYKRFRKIDYKDIDSVLKNVNFNIKLYDEYVKSIFNIDLFKK